MASESSILLWNVDSCDRRATTSTSRSELGSGSRRGRSTMMEQDGQFWSRKRRKKQQFQQGSRHLPAMPMLLVLLFFIGLDSGSSDDGQDGFALLQFKLSVWTDPLSAMADWGSSPDACTWNGITCDHQRRVVSINLPDAGLTGTLSPALAALGQLQRINLRGNNLSGGIPGELGNLVALHKLILGDNELTGQLPPPLVLLPNLETLDVGGNGLGGSIPAALGSAQRLQLLDLSSNRFEGEIPPEVGSLGSLQGTLNLSRNDLSGPIPDSLGNLPPGLLIDLSWNRLSGRIPDVGVLAAQQAGSFINNPGLCGPPLADPCPGNGPAAAPSPSSSWVPPSPPARRDGLGIKQILAIAVGDAVGIVLLGLVFIYCCRRRTKLCDYFSKRSKSGGGGGDAENRQEGYCRKWCCCCWDGEASDSADEGELVIFDGESFDLEDLLRASAFVIGKGGCSIVYKAVLESGLTLAVRRLGGGGGGGGWKQREFETEVQVVGRMKHPCIVRLRAYYCGADEKLLVYDYIPNGSLATALHGQAAPYSLTALTWTERVKIARRVAEGLAHIHDSGPRRYIHGDIRPRNILLNSAMDAYIADFGLSRLITVSGSAPTSRSGSRNASGSGNASVVTPVAITATMERHREVQPYRPPEAVIASSGRPTQKWDVYAFGMVLLELISGRNAVDPRPPPAPQRRQQTAPATTSDTTPVTDLVEWARKLWEGKRPVQESLDPRLSQGKPSPPQQEVSEMLRIALACAAASPDQRPKMKQAAEWLKKLGA